MISTISVSPDRSTCHEDHPMPPYSDRRDLAPPVRTYTSFRSQRPMRPECGGPGSRAAAHSGQWDTIPMGSAGGNLGSGSV